MFQKTNLEISHNLDFFRCDIHRLRKKKHELCTCLIKIMMDML